jgi:hypothetical protein
MVTVEEINHHLFDRLAHRGEPKEGVAEELERLLGRGIEVHHLEAAAHTISTRVKSKTIPDVPTILQHVNDAAEYKTAASQLPGVTVNHVTPDNYSDKALAHMRTYRRGEQLGHMIEPGTKAWEAWGAYFKAKKIPHVRFTEIENASRHIEMSKEDRERFGKMLVELARNKNAPVPKYPASARVVWTPTDRYMVPSQFPAEFDPAWAARSATPNVVVDIHSQLAAGKAPRTATDPWEAPL